MKNAIAFIIVILTLPYPQISGQTIRKDQLQYFVGIYGSKDDTPIANSEDVDCSKLINWRIIDSDTARFNFLQSHFNRPIGMPCTMINNNISKFDLDQRDDIQVYSSYYGEYINFSLIHDYFGMGTHILTFWKLLDPDSLQYIGAYKIEFPFPFEQIRLENVTRFPDNSILLAFSDKYRSRSRIFRSITFTDLEDLYSYSWNKTYGLLLLMNRLQEEYTDTCYEYNFDYIHAPTYQIFEVIRYERHIPYIQGDCVRLDKAKTHVVDLWNLARKRFHIKGKFERYK